MRGKIIFLFALKTSLSLFKLQQIILFYSKLKFGRSHIKVKSYGIVAANNPPSKEVGVCEIKVAIKCSDGFRDLFSDIKCQEEEEN